jgi:hypothetical protein
LEESNCEILKSITNSPSELKVVKMRGLGESKTTSSKETTTTRDKYNRYKY